MVLFLLLLIVAVALGVIGALGRDTLYLLIIGVMVLIADLVLLRTRMGAAAGPASLGAVQAAALEPGVDAGQGLGIVRGGRSGGHVRDHVGAVG
ncbi:hypothetical protein ACR6C2_20240 [Streptomyces sp. INA 01156]